MMYEATDRDETSNSSKLNWRQYPVEPSARVTVSSMPSGFTSPANSGLTKSLGLPISQPAGWTDTKVREYLERHYHRPSDDFKTVVVDMAGSLQFANFVRAMTTSLATGRRPDWNDRAEFTRQYTGEQRPRCR